ncbi:hypothetical protein L1049_026230 [Liquidambar formosana]|uniref:Uncharacterized protein n=1 Tax=Liquidambar formosana TaxID=63359 RepID=A0AAP0NCZ6_LIQFO
MGITSIITFNKNGEVSNLICGLFGDVSNLKSSVGLPKLHSAESLVLCSSNHIFKLVQEIAKRKPYAEKVVKLNEASSSAKKSIRQEKQLVSASAAPTK